MFHLSGHFLKNGLKDEYEEVLSDFHQIDSHHYL